VTFASEQQLKFNQKGTVTKVLVAQGDKVKEGQLIAQLDDSTLQDQIRQANLSVGASYLQLQQLEAQKTQTLIDAQNTANQAQRQAAQAQQALDVATQKLPSDLATAENTVQEKKTALDQAKLNLATTAENSLTNSDQLLDSFYSILTRGTASRPHQGNYDLTVDRLLYRDDSILQRVQTDYLAAVNKSEEMHTTYGSSLQSQTDPQVLASALDDAKALAAAINTLGIDTYALLQGATTDSTRFTDANLNTYRSNVTSYQSSATKIVSDISSAESDVPNAENALSQAQNALTVLQTQTPASLQQQKDSVQQLAEDLQSKQQGVTATDTSTAINIQLKQNDLAQKSAALQQIQQTLKDYQLTAPFDGVITHIDYKVGDNLLDTGDTEYVVLQNPDTIVVTIPLDQVDVVNVRKGMNATIAFDAVPGKVFQGVIDTIDPTPITTSGVVSYNVSVRLPTPAGLTILSGMTSTVTIETSRKDNVLAVPNLSLRVQGARTTVQTATGQSVTVTTGATDGQYTEILTGLQEGQSIVSLNIPRTSTTGSSSNPNASLQLLRGVGGGGGFGGGGGGFGGGGGGGTTRPTGGSRTGG
jgi:RND family efflux transporter MFP subunit